MFMRACEPLGTTSASPHRCVPCRKGMGMRERRASAVATLAVVIFAAQFRAAVAYHGCSARVREATV